MFKILWNFCRLLFIIIKFSQWNWTVCFHRKWEIPIFAGLWRHTYIQQIYKYYRWEVKHKCSGVIEWSLFNGTSLTIERQSQYFLFCQHIWTHFYFIFSSFFCNSFIFIHALEQTHGRDPQTNVGKRPACAHTHLVQN